MKNLKPLRSIQGEINITEGVVSKLGYCIVCNIDTLSVYEIRLSGLAFRICRKCFAFLKEKELLAWYKYGIELIPVKGHSVKIPGYGSNNGYYLDNLSLVLLDINGFKKFFDIEECQVVTEG